MPGQECTICTHPDVQAINEALLKRVSLRNIAAQYGTSSSALFRHKEHMPIQALAAAGREKAESLSAVVDLVIADFNKVRKRFCAIADKAADMENIDAEISAMREVRATMTDTLKAKGMWAPAVAIAIQNNINAPSIITSPEWSVVVRILERHPEIHAELNKALEEAGQ